MKPHSQILVSREAKILAERHCWICRWDFAYGLLLGNRYRVLLALPAASIKSWEEFDRKVFDTTYLVPARQLAASLHTSVIGGYMRSDDRLDPPDSHPFNESGLIQVYTIVCCRQCSGSCYYYDKSPVRRDCITLASGKRLIHSLNQRRIISQWNKMLRRNSYLDEPNTAD
ncbi:MAG: hypothetical protein GX804_07270 [Lentisphaerae bacterium]|jgi:hypothetical protein|nr:hypothetical protein [Lentisphaerota bacterium]